MGKEFSQGFVRAAEDHAVVPLERPARPAAGALTDVVRSALVHRTQADLGLDAPKILSLHAEADYLGDSRHLLDDVDRRYQFEPGTVGRNAAERVVAEQKGRPTFTYGGSGASTPNLAANEWSHAILLALPETEFLTAIEHAVQLGHDKSLFGKDVLGKSDETAWLAEAFITYADGALRAHGAPYRRVANTWRFEWIGDAKEHALTVEPALLALADERLQEGPRDDFERALRKRRLGAPKDLEDAILAAAKSVESVLKVLYDEHNVKKPAKQELGGLFNGLARPDVGVLPGYVQQLVVAVGEPRNHMAGHGPGAQVREVTEPLADASIAAAATAITFPHYLP